MRMRRHRLRLWSLCLVWSHLGYSDSYSPPCHARVRPRNWLASTRQEEEPSESSSLEEYPAEPAIPRRKMDLMWCSEEYCKDAVRERVVGEHNQILLNGPATGQVAYHWSPARSLPPQHQLHNGRKAPVTKPSVLLLVKQADDNLMKVAAEALRELTSRVNVDVLLDPSTAARLKHYHGVDDDCIRLFEAHPTPGFGNNLRLKEDDSTGHVPWNLDVDTDEFALESTPDLICTLGGDGLLMHAGMLFQGPVPPILCVAGGSLGFLTPFKTEEMVDAIVIALGMVQGEDKKEQTRLMTINNDSNKELDVYPPNMPSYPYPAMSEIRPASHRFAFGLGDRICLSIRMRLECRVINREGRVRARYNVLNEVVIDRGSSPYLAALECFCDDVHLTTVQADGVIFATPTGSTAYSLAAGSPVVHPAVPCILVTPICPHVLSFRSMVFPDHVVLRCFVPEDARAEAAVAFDGKHRQELHRGDSVLVRMSPYPVPTINRQDHSSDWLGSLKRNFNFNSRARQGPL